MQSPSSPDTDIVCATALARLVLGMDETAQTQTIADAFDVLSNASANTTVFLTLIESGLSALLRE